MRQILQVFLVVFLIVLPEIVIGQKYSFSQYTLQDGLPSQMTYEILQDSSGLLWVGTENGIVSFDGTEFKRYTHPNLLDNDIIEMSLSSSGRIYFFNLSKQLCYLEDGMITIIKDFKFEGRISTLISKEGKNYISIVNWPNNKSGRNFAYEIVHKSENEIELKPTKINIFSAETDSHYGLWEDKGYFRSTDSTYIVVDRSDLYSENGFYSFTKNMTHAEIIPVDSVLWKFMSETVTSIYRYDGLDFVIKKGKLYSFNRADKSIISILDDIEVNAIFIDKEQNGWVSTPNDGLFLIPALISQLNRTGSDIDIGVNSIFQDKYGTIYLGTVTGEIIIDPLKDPISHKFDLPARPVNFYLKDDIIFAFNERGQKTIDIQSGKVLPIGEHSINRSLCIKDSIVFRTVSNSLTINEFDYFFGKNFVRSQKVIMLKGRINVLLASAFGDQMYVGTAAGLNYYNEGEAINSQDSILNSSNISVIIEDEDGSLWLGTRTRGVYQVKNDSIINHLDKNTGLVANNINNLEKYGSELLVSTTKGLSILDLKTNKVITLNSSNLLTVNEVLVCKKLDNNYWIGTSQDLSIVTRDEILSVQNLKPKISLKNLVVNGSVYPYDSRINLKHTENNLQFNFQNISFRSGREKSIKYRIFPSETEWTTTTDNILRFTSLKPGKYTLDVKGINSLGTESEASSYTFTIMSPWWDTIWGRLLILSVFGIIIYGLFKYRIGQEEQKRQFITQINKIKDQALQLQMNPHFIFNSLNAIQGFIGTDDEEQAMNYLARFAKLIRLIFEHSKGNTISLEEELEFISLYLDLEKLRFRDKVEINLHVDPELEAIKDLLEVPPLLIQPIIENSFKHGLFHKKGRGILNINYRLNKNVLVVSVEDNGIGREASARIAKKNSEKQESSGIKTTQERIDLLNFGKEKKENKISIEDLKDGNGLGLGTIVTLQLKIDHSIPIET